MPFSRKKKSDPAAGLRWHPDFRLRARLPDVKVVRTAFFINGPAALLAVALAAYLAFTEWQLHTLQSQMAEADALIVVPEDATEVPAGASVEVIPLEQHR